jgi:hypothetical protein
MDRYFFDVEDGLSIIDKEGAVFPDLETVRDEALKRTVALLASRRDEFWRGHAWKMIVFDAQRRIQFTLNFMAVSSPLTEEYGRRLSKA